MLLWEASTLPDSNQCNVTFHVLHLFISLWSLDVIPFSLLASFPSVFWCPSLQSLGIVLQSLGVIPFSLLVSFSSVPWCHPLQPLGVIPFSSLVPSPSVSWCHPLQSLGIIPFSPLGSSPSAPWGHPLQPLAVIPFIPLVSFRVEEMKQRSKIVELEGQGEMQRAAALRRRLDSPPVAELQNDIASLVLELERCYGDLKRMPTRAELRGDNRYMMLTFLCSLTHSLSHSLTRSLTHSLTHSFTHSLTHYLYVTPPVNPECLLQSCCLWSKFSCSWLLPLVY